jgi:zinc transport system substrate-binding protein
MSAAPRVFLRRAAVAAIVPLALGACSRSEPERRTVAVSIFPLYDITKRIAGDRADVRLVLPPGRTTHFFEPTPRESATVADASVFFGVGLELDSWMARLVQGAGGGKAQVFDVGPLIDPRLVPEAILALEDDTPPAGGRSPVIDPHFWLDPIRMQRACDIVVDALRTFDPEGSPAYRARAEEVKRSLAQLDEEARSRCVQWRRKRVVTAHGSLFYFSARYGPEIVAVVEPVAGREPSPRYVGRVLSQIKETGVFAVFAENQLDRGPAQAIATEAGVPLYSLDTVGGLSSTDSYEALFRQLLDVFDRTLIG